jgi:aspartate-semialdehyde dehydrogenase
MLRLLEERDIVVDEVTLLASARSAGSTITFRGADLVVRELTHSSFNGIDVALFSSGGASSKEFAPSAAAAGCIVIDNSSAWRMHPDVPLVVPEVNPEDAFLHKNIIANPNCSTIQMVVALKPLHDAYNLTRIVVSTYQSPSGAGQKGVDALEQEILEYSTTRKVVRPGDPTQMGSPTTFKYPIAFNTIFHAVDPTTGITDEETKMMQETRKIMHLPDLPVTVTCVRVPVMGGHGESVYIETEKHVDVAEAAEILKQAPGIVYVDPASDVEYPMPLMSMDTDPVYVGRLRKDPSHDRGLLLWVVADNLRKGAATNAVQILELLAMKEV